MKVLFYGRLEEAIGSRLDIDTPPALSVGEVRDRLANDYPHMGRALHPKRARACVGDRFVHDRYILSGEDTLEFLPPVSGG